MTPKKDDEEVHHGPCLHAQDWGELKQWEVNIAAKCEAILAQVQLTNGRLRAAESALSFGKGAVAVIVLLEMVPKLFQLMKGS